MGFKADCDGQSDLVFSDFTALSNLIDSPGATQAQMITARNRLGGSLAAFKDIGDDHFGAEVGTNGGGIGCTRRRYDSI